MKSPTKQKTGFTLVELMVVIALIALLAGATIPSMISVFTAGADSQAVNLLSAQLTAARALAMREGKYAAVHVQMGSKYDGTGLNKCYVGIMLEDPVLHVFRPISGYLNGYSEIYPVPGTMAFGQIDGYVTDANAYTGITDEASLRAFATFDIVFSPSGALALRKVTIDTSHDAFKDTDVGIWNPTEVNVTTTEGDGRPSNLSVKAVTVFDSQKAVLSGAKMNDYIDKEGQFLPINVHTGLLHPRR
ncbi:MAG: prepilin-type N-terminal cleavage/methylation domain-containing protein [Planctomycetes bacterium]|jgi:prepilin-type N-terminal cleavage/methylation domain-containing protein|nr:prepilin-type N-terminal cleavage/methylation domain-containing protein [Planctomycetota bacterium]